MNGCEAAGKRVSIRLGVLRQAALAQLVEQLICNQQVIGSTPVRGSNSDLSRVVHSDSGPRVVSNQPPLDGITTVSSANELRKTGGAFS